MNTENQRQVVEPGGVVVLRRPRGIAFEAGLFIVHFVQRYPVGAAGAFLVFFLISLGIFAPLFAPYDPKEFIGRSYVKASGLFAWGTDNLGRDVFSRVMWGARLSLYVGFGATLLGTTTGALWGLVCGYYGGGWFDTASQRVVDALQSIPTLILAMVLVAALPPSVETVIIAIGISFMPGANRAIRSLALGLRERDYVTASRAIGCKQFRILWRHMLPNAVHLWIIQASLNIAGAILSESSLSFLGVGVPPDVPTWGGLVNAGASRMLAQGPLLALIPGVFITMAVYGFNLFGDSLRDALDPRLRGSR